MIYNIRGNARMQKKNALTDSPPGISKYIKVHPNRRFFGLSDRDESRSR